MSTERDSLIRMARWGREQGKRNVIADIAPLCEIADEVERLRSELESVGQARDRYVRLHMLNTAEIDRLRAELAAAKVEPIHPVLAWTDTPPTEPGDYWARGKRLMGKQELVRLYRVDSGEMRMDEGRIVPDDLEWWGPVPRPPEKRGGSS